MSYADFLSKADAQEQVAPHVADAYDTCNILFSSGTTGKNDSATHIWPSLQNIAVGCKLSDCR
jgi:acyl-coenzyme A synthetase/AMP-(fatty) acid ligase